MTSAAVAVIEVDLKHCKTDSFFSDLFTFFFKEMERWGKKKVLKVLKFLIKKVEIGKILFHIYFLFILLACKY